MVANLEFGVILVVLIGSLPFNGSTAIASHDNVLHTKGA